MPANKVKMDTSRRLKPLCGRSKTFKLLRLANMCGANNKNPIPIRTWWEIAMNPFSYISARCHYKYNC